MKTSFWVAVWLAGLGASGVPAQNEVPGASSASPNKNRKPLPQGFSYERNTNKVAFFAEFDAYAVSSTNLTGTFELYNGVPAHMAILVGSRDFSRAVWQPYSPRFTVTLGPTNGAYDVWIGLRGSLTNAEVTWAWSGFTLHLDPPDVVLVEPTVFTNSRPIIQVRGYSTRFLSTINYDLWGGNGSVAVSNAPAYITSRDFNPGTMGISKSWFKLVDVPLALGANTLTLRTTADDGLASTNTYTFTFDLKGATNPPALTVYFPQNGEMVCGAQFTFRGESSDPTATATAQIIDPKGHTNPPAAGIVERNGLVWVENLCLGPGTNTLVITLTDAATNTTTTNLSVILGDLALIIDDVPPEALANPLITVTGKINSDAFAIWVNGVEATNITDNLDGTWSWKAIGVPLDNGGTAIIQARAIPKSVNGGAGDGKQNPLPDRVPPNPTATPPHWGAKPP
jgi:hypothetical protein